MERKNAIEAILSACTDQSILELECLYSRYP
ncbi:hypothetical protein SAMN05421783_103218 [Thiocapsa roseopersicina]|uniref:Uncharacterized protein n=1 Tax=Thiocapsa roseopersicina TaxID=1058 RepID=A0A1H2SZM2_THIRO|nr:hypothetical protein SAMN05421783_103218 [Thiocapsa roseopersicina]